MRVGDIELDSSSGISVGQSASDDPVRPDRAGSTRWRDYAEQFAAIPAPVLLFAALWSLLAGVAIGVLAVIHGVWLLLLPAALLLRASGYAAILGTRGKRSRPGRQLAEADRSVLKLLDGRELTADEVGEALGWSAAQALDALVRLIDRGEVEEDLDVETGVWRYRGTTRLLGFDEQRALPARERLAALVAEQSERRSK